jgi:hypothetical protein
VRTSSHSVFIIPRPTCSASAKLDVHFEVPLKARVANTDRGRRWSRHSARKVLQRSAARNDRGKCTSAWRWRLHLVDGSSGLRRGGIVAIWALCRGAEKHLQSRVAPPDFAPQRLGRFKEGHSETEVALVDARNLPLFVRLYCACTCTSSCTRGRQKY